MIALIDSNIILDFLMNNTSAVDEIKQYTKIHVSIISYIEVMSILDPEDHDVANKFFDEVEIVPIERKIANEAAKIVRLNKATFSDAVIIATSIIKNILLVTCDDSLAYSNHPYVRRPY